MSIKPLKRRKVADGIWLVGRIMKRGWQRPFSSHRALERCAKAHNLQIIQSDFGWTIKDIHGRTNGRLDVNRAVTRWHVDQHGEMAWLMMGICGNVGTEFRPYADKHKVWRSVPFRLYVVRGDILHRTPKDVKGARRVVRCEIAGIPEDW